MKLATDFMLMHILYQKIQSNYQLLPITTKLVVDETVLAVVLIANMIGVITSGFPLFFGK